MRNTRERAEAGGKTLTKLTPPSASLSPPLYDQLKGGAQLGTGRKRETPSLRDRAQYESHGTLIRAGKGCYVLEVALQTCFWRKREGLDTGDGHRNSRSQGLLWHSVVLAHLDFAGIPTFPSHGPEYDGRVGNRYSYIIKNSSIPTHWLRCFTLGVKPGAPRDGILCGACLFAAGGFYSGNEPVGVWRLCREVLLGQGPELFHH